MMTELSADQIKRFDTWESAREFLMSLAGRCVFRGVANAEWDLLTSLDLTARYHHAQAEKILIESFERSLPKTINNPPPLDDRVSWLALMRHYGLPSRLLDCTDCISVAAYFAADGEPKSEFAIWAFDIDAVQRSAAESLGLLNRAGAPLSPRELGTDPMFTAAFQNTKRFVAVVDAKHKTERQQKQKGLFLCPGTSEWPFWRNLMDVPSAQANGALYQVIVASRARKDVLADLADKNINREELLPDPHEIEALCTEMRDRLARSQSDCGHLQWKVQVGPAIEKRGLKVEITDQ